MALLTPFHREVRAGLEAATLLGSRLYAAGPRARGDGQPVMLICGLFAGDETMTPLARWLSRGGYRPVRAGLACNVDCSQREFERLERRLQRAFFHHQRPVVIIGHSRGGLFARALAAKHPTIVAGIITLGTPHLDTIDSCHPLLRAGIGTLSKLHRLGLPVAGTRCVAGATPSSRHGSCCEPFWALLDGPLEDRMPFWSVYSQTDGVVSWTSALHPQAQCVAVDASHCGMITSHPAYRQINTALAGMTVTPMTGGPRSFQRAA